TYIPEMIMQVMKTLSAAAIPMMMLLIGANFFDQITGVGDEDEASVVSEKFWGTAILSVLLRCGVFPLLYLAAAAFLPISRELKQVAAIEAAMPAAVFPIVLTRLYGGEPRIALRVTIATTVVGLVTIPLWISSAIGTLGLEKSLIHVEAQSAPVPSDVPSPQAIQPNSPPLTPSPADASDDAAAHLPELVEIDAQTVAGLTVRTNNLAEMNPQTGKIRQLYQRYFSEQIPDLLPNPSLRYAVYHNYQHQSQGEYRLLIGGPVDQPPVGKLATATIMPGKYLKFRASGDQPQAVIDAWRQIAAYFPDSPHRRAYTTDFERYDNQSPDVVEIFVAIE
ncbi:MAG: effector binding domain-containing protein, partial [Blastopirellula sp. JB062]